MGFSMMATEQCHAPHTPAEGVSALPRITVVAALIQRGDTVLIQQRHASGPCASLWELPGGKVETGEASVSALMREAEEELGVALEVHEAVFETTFADAKRIIDLQVFRASISPSAQPACYAAQRQLWCPITELSRWPFCPADVALIQALSSGAVFCPGDGA